VSTDVVLSFYFHLKDIYPAAKIEGISFGRSIIGNTFVPHTESNKFSSSSRKFSQVTNNFSLVPSLQSHECETLACKGVETFCVTSLESMIDNVISELGTQDIEVMTTVRIGNREGQNEEKSYKVTSRVKKLPHRKIVLCHPQPSQQAVFYCHMSTAFERYIIPLEGTDGTKINPLAVCHYDTENFNPIFFEVLKVKPGTKPMCHFLPEDHLIWATH
jgi:BURP domain